MQLGFYFVPTFLRLTSKIPLLFPSIERKTEARNENRQANSIYPFAFWEFLIGNAVNGLISLSTNILCISLMPGKRRMVDIAKSA